MTESFYDVLGVAEDATTDEIESAYRERLKQTHPDVSDDEDAGQATKTLIEARDVLVDEDERARYDQVGHDAYVGTGARSASDAAAEASETAATGDEGASGTEADATGRGTQSRKRREQRASERVRQAREARQSSRQADREGGTAEATTGSNTTEPGTDRDSSSGDRHRARTADATSATATGNTYSVREDVATATSHGPLLPQGRELTLLGIFFALYPVLLFSALLPAFPSPVNLVLGACTLLLIVYLQSMPRVALLCFGGWSGLSLVGLAVFGIGYLSPVGLVVLAGTVFPFGFSVLTASALRY